MYSCRPGLIEANKLMLTPLHKPDARIRPNEGVDQSAVRVISAFFRRRVLKSEGGNYWPLWLLVRSW